MIQVVKAKIQRIIIPTLFLLSLIAQIANGKTIEQLSNGMELIMIENHSSPMVASVIFVKSGSKYESKFENGITHFLEHLLFDGTAHLSREELDRSISDLGGYINAFTRKDLTAYLVLLPKEYIGYGLTVQADMLFNSTLPAEEFPKERKVVIEEIKRSADRPDAPAEDFFRQMAYSQTDYARPVLGFEAFINNIPREAVIAYWKEYYRPDNMLMLLIGDFNSAKLRKDVENIFGRFKTDKSEATISATLLHKKLAEGKIRGNLKIGQQRYDTTANLKSTYINFSIVAPPIGHEDYLPFDLLSSYLSMEEISPLRIPLESGADPLVSELSVSLITRKEFTRLEISAVSEKPELADSIVQIILSQLAQIGSHDANSSVIDGIKISNRCNAIYNSEKLHYYGFMISPMIMAGGWEFIQTYEDRLDLVSWAESKQAANSWLAKPEYFVTVVKPSDTNDIPYKPYSLTDEEVISHFENADIKDYEISAVPLEYPQIDSIKFSQIDNADYHREILSNGLTVIIKSSQDSKVFAVNVLGKDRTVSEPEGKEGITDFINRLLEKGTTSRNGGQLATDLSAIGSNLTLYDNPWIPYDDRYTSRFFSFIKFETIDRFANIGFDLLTDIILNPAFDSTEVENVRLGMLAQINRSSGSPSKVAKSLFYKTLLAGSKLSRKISGNERSIESISITELKEHHRRFYNPSNIILTIATSHDTSEVMGWVHSHFDSLTSIATEVKSRPAVETGSPTEVHQEIDKEQISIYAGSLLPDATDSATLNLKVAVSILSTRLYLNLREKQGLAYSTGASATFSNNLGWYYLTIGTGSDNYQKAMDGLILQSEKLAFDGPTKAEVRSVKNRIYGRLMSSKLSRINQAYYLGLNELLGRPIDYDQQLATKLSQIRDITVRRAASRYFRPASWVIATAGKKSIE